MKRGCQRRGGGPRSTQRASHPRARAQLGSKNLTRRRKPQDRAGEGGHPTSVPALAASARERGRPHGLATVAGGLPSVFEEWRGWPFSFPPSKRVVGEVRCFGSRGESPEHGGSVASIARSVIRSRVGDQSMPKVKRAGANGPPEDTLEVGTREALNNVQASKGVLRRGVG